MTTNAQQLNRLDYRIKLFFLNRIFFVFSFCFLLLFLPRFVSTGEETISVELDATVSDGRYIQVFFNDKPVTQIIKKGERTRYEFLAQTTNFEEIRLDLTDAVSAKFSIHELVLKTSNGVSIFETDRFDDWEFQNTQKTEDPLYQFVTLSSDSIMKTKPRTISYSQSPVGFLQNLANSLNTLASESIIFFGLLALLYLFQGYTKNFILLFSFSLIYFSSSSNFFQFLKSFNWPIPLASESAGWVNFHGYGKMADFVLFFFFIGLFSLFGIIISKLSTKFQVERESTTPYNHEISKFEILLILSAFVILQFPDFLIGYSKIKNSLFVMGWDEMNIFTWKYFFENGYVPLKDFWYPYGNQNLIVGPFWQDLLLGFSHRLFYSILFFSSLYEIFGKKRFPIWATVIIYTLCCLYNLNILSDRYFFSFAVYLFAYSILHSEKKSYSKLTLLSFAGGWLALWEPHQFIYFFFGLGSLAAFDFLSWFLGFRKINILFEAYLKVLGAITISIVTAILLFVFQDKWNGIISFFSQTSGYSNNATLAVDFERILKTPYMTEGNIFHIYFLAFSIIAYGLANAQIRGRKESYFLIGSTAFIFPLMVKNLMRPHMSHQILAIQIVSLSIYFLFFSTIKRKLIQSSLVFIFLGLLAGHTLNAAKQFHFKNIFTRTLHALKSPFKVEKNYFSANKKDLVETYYSPEKVSITGLSLQEISNFIESNYAKKSIYVLGDISAIYLATKDPIPYNISFYDGAHIILQTKLLNWMQEKNIEVILWDWKIKTFDGVPFLVKNPDLFKYVIRNFEFDKQLGEFHFLKRKNNVSSIDFEYWVKHLGQAVDFGFLAANPSRKYLVDCPPLTSQSDCSEFIQIKVSSDMASKIELRGQLFSSDLTVKLGVIKGVDELLLPTRSIWFWEWINTDKTQFFKNSAYKIVYMKKTRDFLY